MSGLSCASRRARPFPSGRPLRQRSSPSPARITSSPSSVPPLPFLLAFQPSRTGRSSSFTDHFHSHRSASSPHSPRPRCRRYQPLRHQYLRHRLHPHQDVPGCFGLQCSRFRRSSTCAIGVTMPGLSLGHHGLTQRSSGLAALAAERSPLGGSPLRTHAAPTTRLFCSCQQWQAPGSYRRTPSRAVRKASVIVVARISAIESRAPSAIMGIGNTWRVRLRVSAHLKGQLSNSPVITFADSAVHDLPAFVPSQDRLWLLSSTSAPAEFSAPSVLRERPQRFRGRSRGVAISSYAKPQSIGAPLTPQRRAA